MVVCHGINDFDDFTLCTICYIIFINDSYNKIFFCGTTINIHEADNGLYYKYDLDIQKNDKSLVLIDVGNLICIEPLLQNVNENTTLYGFKSSPLQMFSY